MRRLEAEALRDSVLKVSGLLDETRGGSMLHVGNREFLFNHTSKDETRYDSLRRSIYLPVIRNNLYDGFSLFDCTDSAVSNSDRATSTVASQALYAMNSPLMLQAGKALSERLSREAPGSDADRIQRLYRLALSREPTADEHAAVAEALQQLQAEFTAGGTAEADAVARSWAVICHTVLASNEFVYVREPMTTDVRDFQFDLNRRTALRGFATGFGWLAASALLAGESGETAANGASDSMPAAFTSPLGLGESSSCL